MVALAIVAGMISQGGAEAFTFLYRRWPGFVTAGFIVAFVQSLGCYLASFRPGALLALGGNTGNPIYDVCSVQFFPCFLVFSSGIQLFIGRELNPSIGSFDLKSFTELRPGLMLWALVDISMACEQYVRRSGTISDSMWLVVLFHVWYSADALYNEVSCIFFFCKFLFY